jgi:hypothetical protein
MSPRKNLILFTVALTFMVSVFLLYTRPDLKLQMANQVRTCF